jgi:methionyl-tRNA formyltransferase
MNIVFFGSAHFAVPSLEALVKAGYNILSVVTQPDRKKGRHLGLFGTQVKTSAQQLGLKIFQPESINSAVSVRFLQGLEADLFVVIAYGQILSAKILGLPKIFALNVHASLLPKYRGAAPINWVIINGEKTTGITVMKMVQKMDAGPLILQRQLNIQDEDTVITLEEKLSRLAAASLLDSLAAIKNKSYNLISQNEIEASFAPKLKKSDGIINWHDSAEDIHNLIRGCLDWPGAFTYYQGKLLKIYKAKVIPLSSYPIIPSAGTILKVSGDTIVVTAGRDSLIIEELQLEGKRRMTVEEFIAGHKIKVGEVLGKK